MRSVCVYGDENEYFLDDTGTGSVHKYVLIRMLEYVVFAFVFSATLFHKLH